MPKQLKSYRDWLGNKLADPKRAARYLNAAAEDSEAMFLKALRNVAFAQTRPMTEIAESCGVSRESLYRMLSETGNPTSENRRAILASLGFKSIVVPLDSQRGAQSTGARGPDSVEDSDFGSPLAVDHDFPKGTRTSKVLYFHTNALFGTPGNTNIGMGAANYAVPRLGWEPLASGTFGVPVPEYLQRAGNGPTTPKGTIQYAMNLANSKAAVSPTSRLHYV